MTHRLLGSAVGVLVLLSSATATSPEAQAWLDHERVLGAQAQGMGSAQTALGEDWTASWHNPAALAWQRRAELNLGYELGGEDLTLSASTDGRPRTVSEGRSHVGHLGYVQPLPAVRGGFCWSAGWLRLAQFDQGGAFPDRHWLVETGTGGEHDAWLFSGAMQLAADLAGGLSLVVHDARLETLDQEADTTDATLWQSYDVMEMAGVSLRLGLQGRRGPLRAGLLLEPAHTLSVDWTRRVREGVLGQPLPSGSRWGGSYGLRVPTLLDVGLAWRQRFWQAGLSWDWQDWSALEYDDLPDGLDLQLTRDQLTRAFQPRHRVRVGGEAYLPGTDLKLRAGAWWAGEARSDAWLTEYDGGGDAWNHWNVVVETPRRGVSLGLGLLVQEAVALDLAVARESWALRQVEFQQGDVRLARRGEVSRWRAQLGLTLRL